MNGKPQKTKSPDDQPQKWCEHISKGFQWGIENKVQEVNVLAGNPNIYAESTFELWKFCPICGKKRLT